MASSAKQKGAAGRSSPVQLPANASVQARSSLGLVRSTAGAMSSRLPAQRNATSPVSPLPPTQPPQPPLQSQGKQGVDGAKEGDRRRRRAARRQSEDPMHAMRSLDRQYGRRRRLNSDYHGCEGDDRHGSGKYNAVELLGELTTVGHKKSLGGASGKASLSLASASTSAVSASNASSGSSMLKRGDSRTLFAAPFCRPHAETVTAFSGRPPSAGVESSTIGDTAARGDLGAHPVATTRRSAHQLMLLADRIAQQQQQQMQVQVQGGGAARLVAATAPSVISAATGVRPRASMPLINGIVPRRGPQRTRSQATRNKRGGIGGGGGVGDDELSDALTMKSVEIRGGRIVLDNPSSSEESDGSDSETSHGSGSGRGGGNEMEMEIEASRLFGTNRHHYHYQQQRRRRTSSGMAVAAGSAGSVGGSAMAQRQSITSSVCSAQSADAAAAAAAAAAGATHWAWDEVLRRQWYTRRCLGLRQPFDSVHRLAKAEHDSAAPFPLLNDLRRVLVETRGCAVSVDGAAPEPADVLLCTDAIVVCATRQQQQDQNQPDQRGRLHAVEFGDELCVQLADDAAGRTVCITGGEDSLTQQQQKQKLVVEFPSSGSARAWMDQAMQARTRLDSALQDLRLDEEDYVDRPPLPLLARGRSSIAGTGAANVSLGPSTPLRMRNAAHGGVYWVPDGEAAACMVCRKTVFSMMVRRHHCRACGLVICYRCSAVATDASDSNDTDSVRRRLCVRCWRQRKMHPMPPAASSSSALALALDPVDAPRHSPSLMTLGRRAAEYLPAGDIVMQLAAQHEAATPPIPPVRKKPDRLARRPISSLFPLAAAAVPEPDASPAG